jgi:outer membrane lipoprotein-sorting protein
MTGSGARGILPARGILLVMACVVLATASAVAEDVPLPAPRPKAQSAAPQPPAAAAAPAAAQPASKGFFPFSLFGNKSPGSSQAASFDAKQRALLDKVSNYLSGVQTMVGNFVQVGPDGRRVDGTFSIQKPGKVRFQYNPPSPIDIIADGSSVVVRDRSLETADFYPLSQTPLRYLLSDRIDLMKDTNVVNVTADDMFVSITIEEKQALVGTSRLMLMVGAKDGQLKQWTVTDPQGYDTTVAVYNLDTSKKIDPGMFKIDFTNYATPPG